MNTLPTIFIEVLQEFSAEPVVIREIRVRFTNGMMLHGLAERLEYILAMVRKMLSLPFMVSNKYGINLHSDKLDMHKGIDSLREIVRSQMGLSPFKNRKYNAFQPESVLEGVL